MQRQRCARQNVVFVSCEDYADDYIRRNLTKAKLVILELNPVKEYNHPKMKILSFSIHPHADGKSGEVAQSPKTFLKPHGKTAV